MTVSNGNASLIKMLNQITLNQPLDLLGEEVAVDATVQHVRAFWTSRMIANLVACSEEEQRLLNAVAVLVQARL